MEKVESKNRKRNSKNVIGTLHLPRGDHRQRDEVRGLGKQIVFYG